jgi:hypothetical protein
MPGILETLVLDHLRPRGSNRWWLPPLLRARLEQGLRIFFGDPRASNEELIRLLKLIAVFEADAAYRDVAQDLIEVLGRVPEAVVRIESWRGRAVVNERHRELLSRFVSSNQEKRAPKIDEGSASGVKLRELSRPIDPAEMRARSSAKRMRPGG